MPDAPATELTCPACGAAKDANPKDAVFRPDSRITVALMAMMAVLTMVTFVRVVQTRSLESAQAAAAAAE